MRNLKRVLALAMAMVMILGMMVIGSSAASYSDAAAIDEDYAEAVEVLSGMGIFQGTGNGFAPKTELDRASAAALIYRVITGDVKDKQVQNYDYASLKDVKAGAWYTGYVTYANNGGYIKGDDLGNFNPNAKVTGIQVLAIMLRAAGYGQNGEYEGEGWMDNILTDAYELKIIGNISVATLNAPASRELVAQLIFNAITKVKMVAYSPLMGGYIPVTVTEDGLKSTQTLATKVFKLADDADIDDWGRPSTVWFKDTDGDGEWDKTAKGAKAEPAYVKLAETPAATYTVATSECDIAEALGVDGKTNKVTVYTNGVKGTDNINALSQAKLGAQGTLIEVYDEDHIVVIDTYLAKITDIITEKTDKNGHVTREAAVELDVWYDTKNVADEMKVDGETEYAEDTYVLVYVNEAEDYVEIVAEAESFQGTQDKIWYNASKHTIDDEDYMDAVNFLLNEAGYEKTQHTWFKDLYGNLIGAADIKTVYSYAVLKDIIWNVGRPGYAEATVVYMDGTEATVTVNEFDGLGIDEINDKDVTVGWADEMDDAEPILLDVGVSQGLAYFPGVSSDGKYNGGYEGYALYEITENNDGTVNLDGIDVAKDGTVTEIVGFAGTTTLKPDARQFVEADGTKIYMTTDTEILVREGNAKKGYEYVPYTVSELTDYAWDTCEIFYTTKTVNGNEIATRIYVKNGVAAAEFGEHLFVTTRSYYELAGEPDVSYMAANVDGEDTVVFMPTELAKYLAKNTNKLFHVEYVENPYSDEYGMIDWAGLINEKEDTSSCDYLAQTITVLGDTIICDGDSYTVTEDTKFIGVDSYDEFIDAIEDDDKAEGVWVLEDAKYVQYADVIYVGTKLSDCTNVTVYADDNMVAYDMTEKMFVYTADSTALQLKAVDANTVFVYGKEVSVDKTRVYANTIPGTYTWTVWAEDGVANTEVSVKIVAAPVASNDTSVKIWIDKTLLDDFAGYTDKVPTNLSTSKIKEVTVNAGFEIKAEAKNAGATVSVGSGETIEKAIENLNGSSVTVTDSTSANGGYVVVKVLAADKDAYAYYVLKLVKAEA